MADERKSEMAPQYKQRVLRLFTMGFLLLSSYFLFTDYHSTISQAEQLSLERLQGIVNDLALRIDGDQHLKLTKEYQEKDAILICDQSEDFLAIHQLLKQSFQGHEMSSPIYTFVDSGSAMGQFEFVATSSNTPYFRHPYTTFPISAHSKLETGGMIEMYSDKFGTWLTAFGLIKNSKGETVAYVQADEQFDVFIAEVRKTLLKNALISLLGFGLVMSFLTPILHRTLREEEDNKNILEKSLEETQRLSHELEESERQLKENAIKLQRSNNDLTDFAHIASHDLKTPIRTIYSFASLIKHHNGKKIDETTQEYLGYILRSSENAQNLIDGLLRYSTVGKDLGEQVKVKMCMIGESACQRIATEIEEKNAEVVLHDMPYIKANPTLISQVLQNLINNGMKYNKSERPKVDIGSFIDKEKGLCFFVRDNGIGIAEKYQANIFNMFTRLHSSSEYEGSGIGLAFCNRVVTTYGGEMWLESIEGEGTTFFFNLPHAYIEQLVSSLEAVS